MEQLMTVVEVSEVLRLRESTIRKWIYKRKLPHLKLGRRVFVRRQDLDVLISTSLVPARRINASVTHLNQDEGVVKA